MPHDIGPDTDEKQTKNYQYINSIDKHIPLNAYNTVYYNGTAKVDGDGTVGVEVPVEDIISSFPMVGNTTLQAPGQSPLNAAMEFINKGLAQLRKPLFLGSGIDENYPDYPRVKSELEKSRRETQNALLMGFPASRVGNIISEGKVLENVTSKAFQAAKEGGKHGNFYIQYTTKSTEEIQKGIRSIEKQIAEHEDKIANPQKYIENFSELDIRQQEALINRKWPSDIERQKEQLDILKGILKERGF